MSLKRLLTQLILVIFVSACEFEFEREEVILQCSDCVVAEEKIILWATPDEIIVKSLAAHNEVCEVIERETIGGQLYYKVECDGPTGWVSEDFFRE